VRFRRPHWPLPIGLISAVLFIGAALIFAAIAVRRKSAIAGDIVLLLAAVWNAGIVFAFMSPHNRHVFHLATHRESVNVNAVIGVFWLIACVVCLMKWYRGRT
jgi:hypothetical protein